MTEARRAMTCKPIGWEAYKFACVGLPLENDGIYEPSERVGLEGSERPTIKDPRSIGVN